MAQRAPKEHGIAPTTPTSSKTDSARLEIQSARVVQWVFQKETGSIMSSACTAGVVRQSDRDIIMTRSKESNAKLMSELKRHFMIRYKEQPKKEVYQKENDLIRSVMKFSGVWSTASEGQLKMRNRLERVLIACHKKQLAYTARRKVAEQAYAVMTICDNEEF